MDKKSRQRLRPWLEGILNTNELPGVCWLNDEKTKFRISWPHGGRQSWSDNNDKEIFKRWAIHTGRFRPNIDKEDYVQWKTRLRCAINKSKDIVLDDDSKIDDDHDPHKVYCFTYSNTPFSKVKNNEEYKNQTEMEVYVMEPISFQIPFYTNEVGMDYNLEGLPSDLQSVESNDLISEIILSDVMNSLHLEESTFSDLDVFLEILFENSVLYRDKLSKGFSGFLIAHDSSVDTIYETMKGIPEKLQHVTPNCSNILSQCPDLQGIFNPGLSIKCQKNDILACSFNSPPLLYGPQNAPLYPRKEIVILRYQSEKPENEVCVQSTEYLCRIMVKTASSKADEKNENYGQLGELTFDQLTDLSLPVDFDPENLLRTSLNTQ